MLNSKQERELVYLARVEEVRPIEGYDRVEYARIGAGWWCVVKKDQFKAGDIAIYFEVDSKVPEEEPFLFLESKHYKVKTQKMCKVVSQGLLMAPEDFGWKVIDDSVRDNNGNIHTFNDDSKFLTKILNVVYSVEEDNKRKAPSTDKYKLMAQRRPNIFKKPFVRKLMKTSFGRKLCSFSLEKER